MVNIDLCGIAQLLRTLIDQKKTTENEARKILSRIAAQTGADIRNTGQLPMYLVQNHHEGIVDRKTFDAVQAEMARRNAGKSPSKKNASTGMTSYASKYALSERLVCGECGTLYRRCTWTCKGQKRIVWRCVSRLDYGKKYCHHSPTLDEAPLQRAILAAINSAMSSKYPLIRQLQSAMELELAPMPGDHMSLADIEQRLQELGEQVREIVAKAAATKEVQVHAPLLKEIADQQREEKGQDQFQRPALRHVSDHSEIPFPSDRWGNFDSPYCSAKHSAWLEGF